MPPKVEEKKGDKKPAAGGKKKGPEGPSSKTIAKEKAKVVDDKTFGLKNKNKSKVVQNQIKMV
jgi:hypothetical protein